MASIDEAYLDMTGTQRLHGAPLRAAHSLHAKMKTETQTQLLDRYRQLASHRQGRLRKGQAQRRSVGSSRAGSQVSRAARCTRHSRRRQSDGAEPSRDGHTPGRGSCRPRRRRCSKSVSENGDLALAGKARGEDAGGWFDAEVGEHEDPKSISHEHTFNEDTANPAQLESTLMRLTEMVARRLREHALHARTIQLKLRYKDFTTITRAHSLADAHSTRYGNLRADPYTVSQELEKRRAGAASRRARLFVRRSTRHPDGLTRRRPSPALAASLGGRRQTARPLRRKKRRPRWGNAGHLPRAHARESGEPARERIQEEGRRYLRRVTGVDSKHVPDGPSGTEGRCVPSTATIGVCGASAVTILLLQLNTRFQAEDFFAH